MYLCSFDLFQRSYKKELFDDAAKHLHKTLLKTEVGGVDCHELVENILVVLYTSLSLCYLSTGSWFACVRLSSYGCTRELLSTKEA